MEDRIMRADEVCRVIGLSRTTLWRLGKIGDFPPATRLGPNSVGWRASQVREWLDSREVAA